MAEYVALRAEIDSDPVKYAGTDAEVSVILNTKDVAVTGITVDSAAIYLAVDDDEAEALVGADAAETARMRQRLAEIYSLSGPIPIDDRRVRKVLLELFPAGTGSKTRAALAALVALQPPNISRAVEIGLGAGRTRESDVFKARAL